MIDRKQVADCFTEARRVLGVARLESEYNTTFSTNLAWPFGLGLRGIFVAWDFPLTETRLAPGSNILNEFKAQDTGAAPR